MASEKRKPNLFIPKSLETLCSDKISSYPDLDAQLYRAYPHNLSYKFNFEKYVNGMYSLIGRRYIRDSQPFERWFRKLVGEKMDLLMENKRDLKKMIKIATGLEKTILKFKKIYGISNDVN